MEFASRKLTLLLLSALTQYRYCGNHRGMCITAEGVALPSSFAGILFVSVILHFILVSIIMCPYKMCEEKFGSCKWLFWRLGRKIEDCHEVSACAYLVPQQVESVVLMTK